MKGQDEKLRYRHYNRNEKMFGFSSSHHNSASWISRPDKHPHSNLRSKLSFCVFVFFHQFTKVAPDYVFLLCVYLIGRVLRERSSCPSIPISFFQYSAIILPILFLDMEWKRMMLFIPTFCQRCRSSSSWMEDCVFLIKERGFAAFIREIISVDF